MTGHMERRRACAPPGWEKPLGAYGVCADCKKIVHEKDIMTHPCGTWVSTGWEAFVNPHNEAGYPGWKFAVSQDSKKAARRNSGKMRTRVYTVVFMVAYDGVVQWVGGPKPLDWIAEWAQREYEQTKPAHGNNYFPLAEWDL